MYECLAQQYVQKVGDVYVDKSCSNTDKAINVFNAKSSQANMTTVNQQSELKNGVKRK